MPLYSAAQYRVNNIYQMRWSLSLGLFHPTVQTPSIFFIPLTSFLGTHLSCFLLLIVLMLTCVNNFLLSFLCNLFIPAYLPLVLYSNLSHLQTPSSLPPLYALLLVASLSNVALSPASPIFPSSCA